MAQKGFQIKVLSALRGIPEKPWRKYIFGALGWDGLNAGLGTLGTFWPPLSPIMIDISS